MEIPAENRAKSLNFVFTFLDFTHLSELYKCLIQHNLLLAHWRKMYYITDKSTDEAKMHDIIILLERKIVHYFALWKILSTALKLYDGMNVAVQIITVRQPTTKAVRSTTAPDDCQKCQDGRNARNLYLNFVPSSDWGSSCVWNPQLLSQVLCVQALSHQPRITGTTNYKHFPAH